MTSLHVEVPPIVPENGASILDSPAGAEIIPDEVPLLPEGLLSPQRGQAVFIRSEPEVEPMSWGARIQVQSMKLLRQIICCEKRETVESLEQRPDEEEGDAGKTDGDAAPTQYRLEATSEGNTLGYCSSLLACFCSRKGTTSTMSIDSNPNQSLAVYLHWVFRVNFIFLFLVMCTVFFVLVIIFAGLIIAAGRMDDECVRIGGLQFGHVGAEFADAFALSWTTFSTVGYGSSYPALGHENDSPSNCLYITVCCSLESFLGVLYSGFCGALLFGKVLRIQSHAQVLFSDPIVIRFGDAVQSNNTDSDSDSDDSIPKDHNGHKKVPCPMLEFRVANRLFNEVGGEIMDATLNVVANVDATDVYHIHNSALSQSSQASVKSRRHYASKAHSHANSKAHTHSTISSIAHSHGSSIDSASEYSDSNRSDQSSAARSNLFAPFGSMLKHQWPAHQSIIEDPSSRFVRKRIFSKMMIEASEHPFFKRVWLARHVLDETSPILKPKVRRQIQRNKGYWPTHLNNHTSIRDSLQFNQILVSLNGVSNVSASDVYAQKIYDFVDINIGYQFVNILYRDSDTTLKVDLDLINDVREQPGGGAEPLLVDE